MMFYLYNSIKGKNCRMECKQSCPTLALNDTPSIHITSKAHTQFSSFGDYNSLVNSSLIILVVEMYSTLTSLSIERDLFSLLNSKNRSEPIKTSIWPAL